MLSALTVQFPAQGSRIAVSGHPDPSGFHGHMLRYGAHKYIIKVINKIFSHRYIHRYIIFFKGMKLETQIKNS